MEGKEVNELIGKVQSGNYAIENNGSLQELNEVLLMCFPEDITAEDYYDKKYFAKHMSVVHSSKWYDLPTTKLPIIKVTEFFNQSEKPSFKAIFESLCEMVEEKDKRYGNSALKPLDIFAKHHPYGSRLDEKLARVKNSEELRKNDIADIIGGLALICQDKGFSNFKDQID